MKPIQETVFNDQKSRQLAEVIKPLRTASYEVDSSWKNFERFIIEMSGHYGGLEMSPDFQRGHVWSQEQKQGFIENVLRGVVSSSGLLVQFNCPNFNDDKYQGNLPRGFQCVDGLQRITAVHDFLAGRVLPFGLHVDDLENSTFSMRHNKFSFRVAIHDFTKKEDLLQHYIDLNAGGTPHSPQEIVRVRALMEMARESRRMNARRTAAEEAFSAYDFGEGVTVNESDSWDIEEYGNSARFSKIVYVNYDDDTPDADSHKLSFSMAFMDGEAKPVGVGALCMETGNEIGAPAAPVRASMMKP